ncbi:MAG: FliH/SctL family protein [Actinomycetota bacterium]
MSTRRIPSWSVTTDEEFEPIDPGDLRRLADARTIGEPMTFGQPALERRLDLDPELRAYVTQRIAEAHAAGVAEGHMAGVIESTDRVDQLAQAVTLTITDVEERMEQARQATTGGIIDLSVSIAEVVLGRTPHDDGATMLRRAEEALDLLDERPLTLTVSPIDVELVEAAAAGLEDVVIATDASLQPGEAQLRGGWSHADLTRAAAWEAIRRHLDDTEASE